MKQYCLERGDLKHLMTGPHSRISCLHTSANDLYMIAVGCSDKIVRVHDNRTECLVMQLNGMSAVPCSLQVSYYHD